MSDLGFSIVEHVLSREECECLATALDRIGTNGLRAGKRNLMSHPAISFLAHDSRLLRIAADVLGIAVVPFRATLFDKSSTSNWHVVWHQDRALPLLERVDSSEWGPWSTKAGVLYALAPTWALNRVVALRIHIDAATNSNGPLRVIPGSHKRGVMSGLEIRRTVDAVSSTPCVVRRGGVVAMRPLLLHSSTKARNKAPRRVLHLEYADRFDFGNGVRLRVA